MKLSKKQRILNEKSWAFADSLTKEEIEECSKQRFLTTMEDVAQWIEEYRRKKDRKEFIEDCISSK